MISREPTPLDLFFTSYPSFRYNPSLPPSQSFKNLRQSMRWKRDAPENNEAWDNYQRALKAEFQLWFGHEDDLAAWHALCKAIQINQLPDTCQACEKAVRNRHVNLVDLIEWGRGGDKSSKRVQIFRTVKALAEYSREENKIFRNDLDEDSDEGGVVLRHLLRRLFTKKT